MLGGQRRSGRGRARRRQAGRATDCRGRRLLGTSRPWRVRRDRDGTLRSTRLPRDSAPARSDRVLCHHAPPRATTETPSMTITANAQVGRRCRGVANGTCAMPGTAPRWRSFSDFRRASRMNDTSVASRADAGPAARPHRL